MPYLCDFNVPSANIHYVDLHEDCALAVTNLGGGMIRIDGSWADYQPHPLAGYGTALSGAVVTSQITAALDAYQDHKILWIISLSANPSSGWKELATGNSGTMWKVQYRIPSGFGTGASATRCWDCMTASLQNYIDFIVNYWTVTLDRPIEDLEFQFWNEVGWGGAGGPSSLTVGTLDGATAGSAGYLALLTVGNASSYGIQYSVATTSSTVRHDTHNSGIAGFAAIDNHRTSTGSTVQGEGTWDTTADWVDLGLFTGKAYGTVANGRSDVPGIHEMFSYILPLLDFHGHVLVAASFEFETQAIAARELATFNPTPTQAWVSIPTKWAFNNYPYASGVGYAFYRPEDWVDDYFRDTGAHILAIRETIIGDAELYMTEFGCLPNTLLAGIAAAGPYSPSTTNNDSFDHNVRGNIYKILIEKMRLLNVTRIFWFSLRDPSGLGGTDWTNNFFLIDRDGNWSMSCIGFAAGNSTTLDNTTALWPIADSDISGVSSSQPSGPPYYPILQKTSTVDEEWILLGDQSVWGIINLAIPPPNDAVHRIIIRIIPDSGSAPDVSLVEDFNGPGEATIASFSVTSVDQELPSDFNAGIEFSYTLTSGEVASISDYENLFLRVNPNGQARITLLFLSLPVAPPTGDDWEIGTGIAEQSYDVSTGAVAG